MNEFPPNRIRLPNMTYWVLIHSGISGHGGSEQFPLFRCFVDLLRASLEVTLNRRPLPAQTLTP